MESILLRTTTRSGALAPGFEVRRREEQLLRFRAELGAQGRKRRREVARAVWRMLKSGRRDSTSARPSLTEAPEVREALR